MVEDIEMLEAVRKKGMENDGEEAANNKGDDETETNDDAQNCQDDGTEKTLNCNENTRKDMNFTLL